VQVVENAPIWPENVPMYDAQGQAPFLFDMVNPVFEHYKEMKVVDPEAFDLLLSVGTVDDPPPREGSGKIVEWEINVVSLAAELHFFCEILRCFYGPLCGQNWLIGLTRWERVRACFHLFDLPGFPSQFYSFPEIPPRVPTKPTTASELGTD
jgi:hypothetical protein